MEYKAYKNWQIKLIIVELINYQPAISSKTLKFLLDLARWGSKGKRFTAKQKKAVINIQNNHLKFNPGYRQFFVHSEDNPPSL